MSRPRLVKNPDLRALLVAMPSSALNRWYDDGGPTSGDGPPSAAYSRVSAPSAFDVLAPFAHALADLVEQTYAVERLATPHREAAEIDPAAESVGFAPGGESAGLTFAIRNGAVDLLAGTWWDGCYPDCACDACDVEVRGVADELVADVQSIVDGGLREFVTSTPRTSVHYVLARRAGATNGTVNRPRVPHSVLRDQIAATPDRWAPWPLR